jgi:hypothetical protein
MVIGCLLVMSPGSKCYSRICDFFFSLVVLMRDLECSVQNHR